MNKKIKCWEFFECNEKECPVYKAKELKCWLIPGTRCRNEIQGRFLEKIEMCLECEPFKANIDTDSLKATLKLTSKQFKEFRGLVEKRDKELEEFNTDLTLGLSEVFEALKNISSGDPEIRIPETSKHELIAKLKHMVNLTAGNLGEIVNLSHEFAIGLAEHFDVLHRVSNGDLNARVSGTSQVELLESLKKLTNQMIEDVSGQITERKRAENEANEARQKAELILKTIPSGLMTVDLNRRITSWNKYAEVVTGVPAEEAIGKECQSVFNADTCMKDCSLYNEHIAKPIFGKECVITVKGRTLTISKNIELLRDNEGNVVGGLETFVDVTYRKRMEDQLVISERYKTISDISRDVAHNFNNLLTTVKGNVQLLLMNPSLTSDEETKTSLDEIHERADDMAQLVSDMQHFARDNEVFSDEKTDIIPVLELAVKIFRPVWKDEARKSGIDIDIIRDIVEVPHVRGGRQDYQTIFKNILSNAIEAMTRSGKIWIGTSLATEEDVDFVRVTICDEGRGMDEATCARAIEPLFSTKSTVGVGIGLTVAYGIVQNLGGTLTIESKPDKGTTVAVTVPVADPELITASSTYEKQDGKAEQQGKAYQILVVDDEDSVRNLLARSLKKMGHEVVGAGNGVEALKITQDKRFDLAFVDWSMPHMNGLELIQKLQETCPEMPVVMVTGWSDKENMESLSAAGIDHVITKPFDIEKIKETIEQLLNFFDFNGNPGGNK